MGKTPGSTVSALVGPVAVHVLRGNREELAMRRTIVPVSRVLGATAAACATLSMLCATPAFAATIFVEWTQDIHLPGFSGSAGCARSIAVGPNNQPWVLGCSGPDGSNLFVYQLEKNGSSASWVTNHGAGVYVAVDSNSVPWLLTNDGEVWLNVTFFNGPPQWSDTSTFYGTTSQYSTGRLSGIAPLATNAQGDWVLWGLGWPAAANNSIWNASFDITDGGDPWSQVDAQDGAAAAKIVLFTGTAFGTAYQTPVVMNNAGNVFSYNSSTGGFTQIPASPVSDITDHWVIALYEGFPTLFRYEDLGGGWTQFPDSLTTPNGTQIVRIAYSNTGPGALWGIDLAGNIYTSNPSVF
jgi:hypothetical protein